MQQHGKSQIGYGKWKKLEQKRVCTILFHLYKILEDSKKLMMTERRSVMRREWRGVRWVGQRRSEGHDGTFRCESIFIFLIVVMVS